MMPQIGLVIKYGLCEFNPFHDLQSKTLLQLLPSEYFWLRLFFLLFLHLNRSNISLMFRNNRRLLLYDRNEKRFSHTFSIIHVVDIPHLYLLMDIVVLLLNSISRAITLRHNDRNSKHRWKWK